MEIIFTLRKNGGYRTSGLGGRSFPVVRQAGWLKKIALLRKLLLLYSTHNTHNHNMQIGYIRSTKIIKWLSGTEGQLVSGTNCLLII